MAAWKPYTAEKLRPVFGPLTDSVMQENSPCCLENALPKDIPMRWDQLQTLLRVLPEPSDVERLLLKLHGKTSLGDLGIDGSLREDILHWSPLVRNRMTFMRLLHTMETETLL